jgi:hypothetical protein
MAVRDYERPVPPRMEPGQELRQNPVNFTVF